MPVRIHFITQADERIPDIRCEHISESTRILKGLAGPSKHISYDVTYARSCFKYVTPEEFISTHYDWLYRQAERLYEKQPDIGAFFDIDDTFQEFVLHLPRILSKFDQQCNLRTFVANRLRKKMDSLWKENLKVRLGDYLEDL